MGFVCNLLVTNGPAGISEASEKLPYGNTVPKK